jgi:hypothetical protein
MRAKKIKLVLHSDSMHGWVEADRKLLKRLKIADKISKYSYQLDSKVFLEEDCDANLLINALEQQGKAVILIKLDHGASANIRRYQRYQP